MGYLLRGLSNVIFLGFPSYMPAFVENILSFLWLPVEVIEPVSTIFPVTILFVVLGYWIVFELNLLLVKFILVFIRLLPTT